MVASKSTANLTDGSNSVDILIEKFEEGDDKELSIFPIPSKNLGAGTTLSYIVDLQRLKESITITGYLVDETGSSSYSKKVALKNMKTRAGTLTLTWIEDNAGSDVNRSETVNIMRDQITMVSGRIGASTAVLTGLTQGVVYSIMIQLIKGTHKG